MIDEKQFKECIIIPTLQHLDPIIPYSEAAVELLMGTAMVESGLTYLRQLGWGPALGVYQMEPATHDDIWENYLEYNWTTYKLLRGDPDDPRQANEMVGNMNYATTMARIHYYRVSEALPEVGDVECMAHYWKKYYNSVLGKGTVLKYLRANGEDI